MGPNTVFFAWNRTIPGREQISAAHFAEFVQYLTALQKSGKIGSFEPVFLEPHGGDMNGFFLIRGDAGKLDAVVASTEWITHMTRASLHLEGSGAVRGRTGELVGQMMDLWSKNIPR